MANDPLRYEIHGIVGEGTWFRLYECEHVTSGVYPIVDAIPIGDHANLILCKHCMEGLKAKIAKDILELTLKGMTPAQLTDFIAEYTKVDTLSLQSAIDRDRLETSTSKRDEDHDYQAKELR